MKNIKDVVNGGLCLGCGLCALSPDVNATPVTMKYSKRLGHLVPYELDIRSTNAQVGFNICPGKGYNVNSLAKDDKFGEYFHLDLGFYNQLAVVNGVNPVYRKN